MIASIDILREETGMLRFVPDPSGFFHGIRVGEALLGPSLAPNNAIEIRSNLVRRSRTDHVTCSALGEHESTFKEYITDPKKKVPGNKMLFPGVQDETERDDLFAYVSSFGPDGNPKN
jgi:hypothetical protein